MRAVIAILVDGYRELSSRKLFWITLILSSLLVIAYASIGFTETGMSLFFGLRTIESEYFNVDSPLATVLYKAIFSMIVSMWLAWAAAILALISTASIFPDLVARGSIDLMLSKPVSRVTIFFAKFASGLLFAILQVGIVCIGVFIALGWRLGEWNWVIFAAIPIVTVFFSYLFAISALAGVVTRSSITALLLAIVFWLALFSLQQTEGFVLWFKMEAQVAHEAAEQDEAELQERLAELDPDDEAAERLRVRLKRDLDAAAGERESQHSTLETLERWHGRIDWIITPLPKTALTIDLLNRWLISEDEISFTDLMAGNFRFDEEGKIVPVDPPETEGQRRVAEHYESKSYWYILGTSLLFEAFILLLACWMFVRRDF
jgi:ABC-type transport system involved in multi-copper enzyme maturation permease subunit